ncbi:hypothetical protein L6R49_02710 [Myxococcota bacterium]|nr:hypothetical protein [Myxococcota bacterium]
MPLMSSTFRVVAAGAALSLNACDRQRTPSGGEPLPGNPPAQNGAEATPTGDAPEVRFTNPPEQTGPPTWNEVRSSHPEGATNPPSPLLIVTADGATCYKAWRPARQPPDPVESQYGGWVIPAPDPNAGVEVVCPPDAARVLAAWRAEQDKQKQ